MEVAEKRKMLEQRRIGLQLKQSKDVLYTHLLIILGTVSVLISALMLLISEITLQGQSFGLLAMGSAMVGMGSLWQFSLKKQLEKVEEDITHCDELDNLGIKEVEN